MVFPPEKLAEVLRRISSASKKGKRYTLRKDDGKYSCSCPDFKYRHSARGTHCKHIAAHLAKTEKKAEMPMNLNSAYQAGAAAALAKFAAYQVDPREVAQFRAQQFLTPTAPTGQLQDTVFRGLVERLGPQATPAEYTALGQQLASQHMQNVAPQYMAPPPPPKSKAQLMREAKYEHPVAAPSVSPGPLVKSAPPVSTPEHIAFLKRMQGRAPVGRLPAPRRADAATVPGRRLALPFRGK